MQDAFSRTAFDAALARGGVRAALACLNGLSGHRYTALYRFAGPVLRNLFFYDRDAPAVEETDDFPVEVTYCVYVQEFGRPFVVEDALREARAGRYPARADVMAYCGVPLRDAGGLTFGTLCHFDVVPVAVPAGHLELLEELAPLLAPPAEARSRPAPTVKRNPPTL